MRWVRQSIWLIDAMARRGIDLIYPPQCAVCSRELDGGEREIELCDECQKKLLPQNWSICPACGTPLVGPSKIHLGGIACRGTGFHFASVAALGDYHGELGPIILGMKRKTGAPLALAMGKLLATQWRETLDSLRPELVLPVPMHWWHRIRRGMNNPDFIAHSVANTLQIPCRRRLLVCRKKTRRQSELPPHERFSNVRGAFKVRLPQKIEGRRILLVDDVLTTGATCNEAAKMLKEAGAAMVAVAVVARTI
jgi:ComF family protein